MPHAYKFIAFDAAFSYDQFPKSTSSSASTSMSRRADVDEAYEIQRRAAIRDVRHLQGVVQATGVASALAVLAHRFWPTFRRQTFQFKAFLVTGCAMFGLILGAERALLAYEVDRRVAENDIRQRARIELTRQGIVPTETEIAKWRAGRSTGT